MDGETKLVFAPAQFLADFRSFRGAATFPQKPWHRALARACELDDARRLANYYRRIDLAKCRTPIQYRERIETDGVGKINGYPIAITLRWRA